MLSLKPYFSPIVNCKVHGIGNGNASILGAQYGRNLPVPGNSSHRNPKRSNRILGQRIGRQLTTTKPPPTKILCHRRSSSSRAPIRRIPHLHRRHRYCISEHVVCVCYPRSASKQSMGTNECQGVTEGGYEFA